MTKENIFQWGKHALLTGIFTPAAAAAFPGTCMVFLNAGMIHKVGPNRIYVTMARQLAAAGMPCFRFDHSGMGDSSFSVNTGGREQVLVDELKETLDMLTRKSGCSRFILCGMCSGAEAAFHAAVADHRITGLVLIDGIYPAPGQKPGWLAIGHRNNTRRYYRKNMFDIYRWKKLLSGKNGVINIRQLKKLAALPVKLFRKRKDTGARTPVKPVVPQPQPAVQWELLMEKKMPVFLIFSEGGIALDVYRLALRKYLQQPAAGSLFHTTVIKNTDHTFTPVWSQQLLGELVTGWVKTHFSTAACNYPVSPRL